MAARGAAAATETGAAAPAGADATAAAGIAAGPAGFTEALLAVLKDKNKELSRARKKRVISPETATAEQVAALVESARFTPHSPSAPGITALAVHPDPAHQNIVLTGGNDKAAMLFDLAAGKVVSRLAAHTRRVTGLAFHADRDVLYTASADATARVWVRASGSEEREYSVAAVLRPHTKDLVSVSAHPISDYILTASTDATWAVSDAAAGSVIAVVADGSVSSPYTSAAFHPDGLLIGAGNEDGVVRVFDLRDQSLAASLSGHAGAAASVAFSENGYYMASAGVDGTARIWDLRKVSEVQSLSGGLQGPLSRVAFDHSGHFLAVGATSGHIAVWDTKEWRQLLAPTAAANTDASGGAAVSGLLFMAHGHQLITSSLDRSMRVFKHA